MLPSQQPCVETGRSRPAMPRVPCSGCDRTLVAPSPISAARSEAAKLIKARGLPESDPRVHVKPPSRPSKPLSSEGERDFLLWYTIRTA
eukprot:1920178-Rhodomonas_salina.4